MCRCSPSSCSFSLLRMRVMASRAWSRGSPNLESAPPVDCDSWVSGATPGMILISTRCGRVASCSSRSMSSKLSTTTVPTPASSAMVSSAVVLALPCWYIRSGGTPAARAMTSSPAPGHVDAQPRGGEQLVNGQAGQRLGGEHHLGVRVAGGQAVLEAAGLVPQPGLVHDVGGRAEAFGQVTDPHAADGQFPVRADRAVLGKEREQVAA